MAAFVGAFSQRRLLSCRVRFALRVPFLWAKVRVNPRRVRLSMAPESVRLIRAMNDILCSVIV